MARVRFPADALAKKETVLVIVAHNDDHIIGAGGTLAKYAKEGKKLRTIIFLYGEKSHPHLKPGRIKEMRYRESLVADKILGGSGIVYLGLKETKFLKQYKKKGTKKRLAYLIRMEKPSKIFTFGPGDIHPDHRAVAQIIEELIKEKVIKCDVFGFEVWSAVKVRKRNVPKLFVDISKTYVLKSQALDAHKSQTEHIFPFIPLLRFKMWLQSIINGWNHGYKHAEVFAKLN